MGHPVYLRFDTSIYSVSQVPINANIIQYKNMEVFKSNSLGKNSRSYLKTGNIALTTASSSELRVII